MIVGELSYFTQNIKLVSWSFSYVDYYVFVFMLHIYEAMKINSRVIYFFLVVFP